MLDLTLGFPKQENGEGEGSGEHGHSERKLSGAPTRVAVIEIAHRPLPLMGTRIPIFRQVEVTIVVVENDTPI